jgi:hypothetical protein
MLNTIYHVSFEEGNEFFCDYNDAFDLFENLCEVHENVRISECLEDDLHFVVEASCLCQQGSMPYLSSC